MSARVSRKSVLLVVPWVMAAALASSRSYATQLPPGESSPPPAHEYDPDGTESSSAMQLRARDSLDARRTARRAQARFESRRRHHLPFASGSVGAQCDERIGRLCYWYNPEERITTEEEAPEIAQARATLLRELDEALVLSPHDGWISGQQVRYLLEAGSTDSALMAASRCTGAAWWCSALGALAMHVAGAPSADSIFLEALQSAPADIRCEWSDLSLLLVEQTRRRYRDLECGVERDSANAIIWWLAQPLHARSGNERRAEHHARMTMTMLYEGARNPYGMRWDDDMRELLIRYGWSRTYTRSYPRSGEATIVTGYEPAPSFEFLPHERALDDPLRAEDEDWDFRARRARSRYAPPWASRNGRLEAQVATFRRADSALIVASWTAPLDHDSWWWAGLAASEGPAAPMIRDSVRYRGQGGSLLIVAPLRPLIVSVELLQLQDDSATGPRDSLHAARLRQSVLRGDPSSGSFALSTPLLLTAADSAASLSAIPDAKLEQVLSRMAGSRTVSAPGRMAIFWETYGLPVGRTPARLTLVLRGGERRPWLGRLSDRILGRRRAPPPLMAWSDVLEVRPTSMSSGESVVGREVTLELPPIAAGDYELELQMQLEDGRRTSTTCRLVVRRS